MLSLSGMVPQVRAVLSRWRLTDDRIVAIHRHPEDAPTFREADFWTTSESVLDVSSG